MTPKPMRAKHQQVRLGDNVIVQCENVPVDWTGSAFQVPATDESFVCKACGLKVRIWAE